jgi:PAP2 superfamily
MRESYRRWSEHPYLGEHNPPIGNPEPSSWPMFFIRRESNNTFFDPFHQRINWNIKNPNEINWEGELLIVEQALKALTTQHLQLAQFWGTREITARISDITFDLASKNRLGSPDIARVLGFLHSAMNDAFVITWFFKYFWDVARPNQYERNLPQVLSTPLFPSYPSAHATVAGCAEVLLRYFFPRDASIIKRIIEESAQSRLYAGVHFKVDNDEGLRLGRQIGQIVEEVCRAQGVK